MVGKIDNRRLKPTWNMLWIFLFGAGFALFLCGMPKYYDDFWFMAHLRPWFDAQGLDTPEGGGNILKYGFPADLILDTWSYHFYNDNARLGNLIAPLLLLFPKWVGSGLVSVMLFWSVMLAFGIADIDWKHSPLVPVALFLWTFMSVWSDHFGCLVFQLNYIAPTWLALLVIQRIFKRIADPQYPDFLNTHRFDPLSIIISFLLGLWHEGFGVPIGIALLCTMVFCRNWRSLNVVLPALAMFAGATLLLCVPGMRHRTAGELPGIGIHRFQYIYYFFKDNLLLLVADIPLFIAALLCRRKKPSARLIPIFIIAMVSGLALVAVRQTTTTGTRVIFWTQFFAVVLFIGSLHSLLGKATRRYSPWSAAIAAMLIICMTAHLAVLDFYSLKCRRIMESMVTARKAGKETYYFESENYFNNRSFLLADMPEAHFNLSANAYIYRYLHGPYEDPNPDGYLLPRPFLNVTGTSGTLIGAEQGIRDLEGCMFVSKESLLNAGFSDKKVLINAADVDYGKGFRRVPCTVAYFRSPADGREYAWLIPHVPWHLPYIRQLQNIRIIPIVSPAARLRGSVTIPSS